MPGLQRWFVVCCVFAGLPCLVASTAAAEPVAFHVPEQLFAGEPRGAYETGTFEELWVDEAREDPSTADPNDKRKVLVQVWYPAIVSKDARRASYAINPQLYAKDHWVHRLAHVQTRSMRDAPPAAAPARFPVLIYNHGGLHPHFSATYQTEFLASQGFVVVAIGHPGANEIERFPDGTAYVNDGVKWMAQAPNRERLSPRDKHEYGWVNSDLRFLIEDIRFVLDRLVALDAAPEHRFHRRLDLDRVGALGWSLGGFVSLQAARDEPRIKAAANLDGWPYGLLGPNGVVTLGSEKPVLLMIAGSIDWGHVPHAVGEVDAGELEAGLAAVTLYWTMLRRTTADWYQVTVDRTTHESFADNLLFVPQDPHLLHPRAAHAIINGYVLAFFDRYVRGSGEESPLLSGKQQFPEATLLRGPNRSR